MKKFICLAALCLLFSCHNDYESAIPQEKSEFFLQKEHDVANQKMTDYLTKITTDVEQRKKYIEEVNQKPGDEEWRLECFRKHYKEFPALMENIKKTGAELEAYKFKNQSNESINK